MGYVLLYFIFEISFKLYKYLNNMKLKIELEIVRVNHLLKSRKMYNFLFF